MSNFTFGVNLPSDAEIADDSNYQHRLDIGPCVHKNVTYYVCGKTLKGDKFCALTLSTSWEDRENIDIKLKLDLFINHRIMNDSQPINYSVVCKTGKCFIFNVNCAKLTLFRS